jgi:hypothetical protein
VRVVGLTRLQEKREILDEIIAASGLPLSEIDIVTDAQDLPRAVSHEELAEMFLATQGSTELGEHRRVIPSRHNRP